MIKMIWAQTKKGVIGKSNGLPWNIPQEMNHFRKTTSQQNILMGSSTFDSLNQKPLPNRENYVLTNDISKYQNLSSPNLHFVTEIAEIIQKYQGSKNQDIYIIGGNQIFTLFFPYADEIIRTIIFEDYPGDLKITDFDFADFKLQKVIAKDEFEIQYFERSSKNNA